MDDRRDFTLSVIEESDHDALFALFSSIVNDGEGYPHLPPLTHEDFAATWLHVTQAIGVFDKDELGGAYYLKPNFPGRGRHIANAGYIVNRRFRGCGLGKLLVEDSIERAPKLGFDAIQFNFVFSSNPARALYEELGWDVIGRIPNAIPGDDAIIYWRAVP